MKVLVINASANREKSTTMILTRSFLEGLGETGEVINTADLDMKPCKACYACWFATGGKCVQKDDAAEVLEKIREADLVIWSIPLYAYGAPSHCKTLMDRTLCFNSPEMYIDEKGIAHHYGYEEGTKKTVLISTAGLPTNKGNFDALVFQMRHMYGERVPAVCCAEGSLFMNEQTASVVAPYIESVKKAGMEYRETGRISESLQEYLDTLIVPAGDYVKIVNGIFKNLMNSERSVQS